MDVKLATLIKSLNIMDVIFSGFTVNIMYMYMYMYTLPLLSSQLVLCAFSLSSLPSF